MLMLTGEFEHTVDEKGRLFVSNKLRSMIDSAEYGADFYLTLGANGILCLYPEKCYEQIAYAVASGTSASDDAVAFERLTYGLGGKVELDRQGRLLINEKLRKRVNLGSHLTVVGVRDHIEIWNTEDWERYLSENVAAFQNQVAQTRHLLLQKQNRKMEDQNLHTKEDIYDTGKGSD